MTVISDKNTAEAILLFGNEYDFAYESLSQDDILPISISYERKGWLRDYLKSISARLKSIPAPLDPGAAPQLPHFSYEQMRWFDEQINHVPSDLRNQAYQQYRHASQNSANDVECLRLSNIWLRETVQQVTGHPLAGTMHHYELAKQLIDNKYSAPVNALKDFTDWVLKNADSGDSHIREIASVMTHITEKSIKDRLGAYADPFFREKDPIKPNEKNLRRQLRKAFRQANEMSALCLRKVSARGERYVSDLTLSNRTHQLNAQNSWIDRTTCESGDKKIPLRNCIRTPEAKMAEMLKMSEGLEKFCSERGDKAMFITLTAPSSYHPNPAYGKSCWDGSSPLEAHRWFTQNWKLFRTALSDASIKFDGIRVIEPHKDGCPHAHILMYVKPSRYKKVIKLFEEYFAHSSKAVKIEEIDPKKGTATGYLLKYVVKNVTGASSDDPDIQDSAARADAFRSAWGIRAFSYFGVLRGRITTWRELRRLEVQPNEKFAQSLWRAARGSNAHKFIELLANKDKKDEIKTIRKPRDTGEFTEPNTDGEIMPIIIPGRILGIAINKIYYITHPTKWDLVSLFRTDDAIEKINTAIRQKIDSAIRHSPPRNPKPTPPPPIKDTPEWVDFLRNRDLASKQWQQKIENSHPYL